MMTLEDELGRDSKVVATLLCEAYAQTQFQRQFVFVGQQNSAIGCMIEVKLSPR